MGKIDEEAERAARAKVRRRGLRWLCFGMLALCAPFLLVALTDNVRVLALASPVAAVGFALSPILISAGVVDVFWPRTPTSPISRMQL